MNFVAPQMPHAKTVRSRKYVKYLGTVVFICSKLKIKEHISVVQ